jgi:hypothetical protein
MAGGKARVARLNHSFRRFPRRCNYQMRRRTGWRIGLEMSDRHASVQPVLRGIHPENTYERGSAKLSLESVRRMPTDDIVKSLAPGAPEPLTVKPDGRIFDGNTRVKVLLERGYDINSLPCVMIR